MFVVDGGKAKVGFGDMASRHGLGWRKGLRESRVEVTGAASWNEVDEWLRRVEGHNVIHAWFWEFNAAEITRRCGLANIMREFAPVRGIFP